VQRKSILFVFITFLCLACLTFGQTGAAGNTPRSQLSIDELFEIYSVVDSRPQWSPDGSQLIFISSLNKGGLISLSTDGGFPKRMPFGFRGMRDPKWSPDGRWIAYLSSESGSQEIWLWSTANGRNFMLTDLGGRISAFNWSPDSKWIAFCGDRYGNYDIWKVAAPEGSVYRLTSDERYEVNPSWTPDGKNILHVRLNETWTDHDVIRMNSGGNSPGIILRDSDFFDYGAGRDFGFPQVSPDGRSVLFRSHRSGWINYWTVPLSGGEARPVAKEAADQSDARWSPDSRWIVFTSNHNGTLSLKAAPAAGGPIRSLVSPEIGVCANPEWSPDGKEISYTLSSPSFPRDLYILDFESGESRRMTYSMPEGNFGKVLAAPEKITYPSRDGYTISAYLYRQKDIPAGQRLPALIWVHGGPTGQYIDNFHHQNQSSQQSVQFFVQRGYVVLQPNVRGSSGYGKAFEKANNKSWGKSDLDDVLAGAKYLKSLPYVNPHKLAITGRSYGGMLTMMVVTNAPGVFQAACAESGYADWIRGIRNEEFLGDLKMYDYELGPLEKNEALYRELSPIHHVEKVTTPIFLIHGEGQGDVSPESKLFATRLAKYYKVFWYKAYPNDGYYVHGLENRKQMLADKLRFYDKFLKDKIVPEN